MSGWVPAITSGAQTLPAGEGRIEPNALSSLVIFLNAASMLFLIFGYGQVLRESAGRGALLIKCSARRTNDVAFCASGNDAVPSFTLHRVQCRAGRCGLAVSGPRHLRRRSDGPIAQSRSAILFSTVAPLSKERTLGACRPIRVRPRPCMHDNRRHLDLDSTLGVSLLGFAERGFLHLHAVVLGPIARKSLLVRRRASWLAGLRLSGNSIAEWIPGTPLATNDRHDAEEVVAMPRESLRDRAVSVNACRPTRSPIGE